MTIGDRILELAREQGITQAELAGRLDINQTTISKWGKGAVPAADKIPELSAILGVSVEYLLTGASVVPFSAGLSAPASASSSSSSAPLSGEVERLRSELSEARAELARKNRVIDRMDGYLTLLEEKLAAASPAPCPAPYEESYSQSAG